MSTEKLVDEVMQLLELLSEGKPAELGVIPWASPVLAFGDPVSCQVATLGLNPSNLEFVDRNGQELLTPHHRLESLTTLRANDWNNITTHDARKVWLACKHYFQWNPYDQWFKRLEKLLVGTGASYYTSLGPKACHLDLVPFATSTKWSSLSAANRAQLIKLGAPSLAKTIRASDVRVLILNGSAVVREFNRLAPSEPLKSSAMTSWDLQNGRVGGVAHIGRVSKLGNFQLDRELLVLGYNHNIQSSFGVTNEAVFRIATWIADNAARALQ